MAEFLKSLGKLVFALAFLTFAVSEAQHRLLLGMVTQPGAFGLVIREIAIDILLALTFAMVIIGAADFVWSRFHWRQDLRMTRQEVKDELKQSDGDPIIKSRMRSLARDRARRRMMAAVPRATLVIANPTHFSIALKYVRQEDSAPVVLAKGQDLVALRIREIAEANGIPIFEDVALARSMYKQVSVDSVIPAQFYQAVAELVRIVYASKTQPKARQIMNRQPHSSARERLVANAIKEVVSELRMVDVGDYVAFIRMERFANVSDIVDSAAERFFMPGTLKLGHGGEAHLGWSGEPKIVLDLELRPRGATVYFKLAMSADTAAVDVNYVAFEDGSATPAENTAFLGAALEGARIRRSEPLGL